MCLGLVRLAEGSEVPETARGHGDERNIWLVVFFLFLILLNIIHQEENIYSRDFPVAPRAPRLLPARLPTFPNMNSSGRNGVNCYAGGKQPLRWGGLEQNWDWRIQVEFVKRGEQVPRRFWGPGFRTGF